MRLIYARDVRHLRRDRRHRYKHVFSTLPIYADLRRIDAVGRPRVHQNHMQGRP